MAIGGWDEATLRRSMEEWFANTPGILKTFNVDGLSDNLVAGYSKAKYGFETAVFNGTDTFTTISVDHELEAAPSVIHLTPTQASDGTVLIANSTGGDETTFTAVIVTYDLSVPAAAVDADVNWTVAI